jgi:hypothetical protein
VLDDAIERFGRAGYPTVKRLDPLSARLSGQGKPPLRLQLVPDGKIFGGTYGLEVSTAEPVLPQTRGLTARGRGVVRMRGVAFHARRSDEAGQRLAAALEADTALSELLSAVHFERIRVEPDGRPLIRHMGGSLVWILFPPLIRRIPLIDEQVQATVAALERFAARAPLRS